MIVRMVRGLVVSIAVVVVAGSCSCSKASDEDRGTKRTPMLPPPDSVEIPAALKIDVSIDGAAAAPITADRLRAVKPDFEDAERRAWRLTHVVPELDKLGATVEAKGPAGVSLRLERSSADGLQPVLVLTRRGDVGVAAVDPNQPFPDYHGQGQMLRRPGDPLPRLLQVTALVVTRPPT
jgi:hypothetical protein